MLESRCGPAARHRGRQLQDLWPHDETDGWPLHFPECTGKKSGERQETSAEVLPGKAQEQDKLLSLKRVSGKFGFGKSQGCNWKLFLWLTMKAVKNLKNKLKISAAHFAGKILSECWISSASLLSSLQYKPQRAQYQSRSELNTDKRFEIKKITYM